MAQRWLREFNCDCSHISRPELAVRGVLAGVGVLATACLLPLFAWVKLRDIPENSQYVGSHRCATCHRSEHAAWEDSLHNRMMRPVNRPGVVVAEFDEEDHGLRFELEDAVWAIGGKWEQQFMGHDGETETLLPGAWLGRPGHWDFKGWDGWQTPVPLRRCHGCHTVGLDVTAGRFVEANIGCESCHGPAEWHVDTRGLGRIYRGLEAEVCGQCHTRGRSTSGEFFFPVGYRPGDELDPYFEYELPSEGQNSSYWWGNGHERHRHQQYWAWRQGGHADSLSVLTERYDGRYGALEDDCLRCHAGESAVSTSNELSTAKAAEGITCSVCHNVHGSLDEPRVACDACHTEGAFYHQPERNADHVPCPSSAAVSCVGCHMPQTIQISGEHILHSHRPGVVPPEDTLKWQAPSSCANGGCHLDETPEELQAVFGAHYGEPRDEG